MILAIAFFLSYIPLFVWAYTEYKNQRNQLIKSH